MVPISNINAPNNSLKNRNAQVVEREKTREMVSQAKVRNTKRKKYGLADLFVCEDIDNISEFIIRDVIVPTIKDIAIGSLEMLFYGEFRGKKTYGRKKERTRVSYDKPNRRNRDYESSRRARFDFDSIAWDSRGEAEEILDLLIDCIEDDGEVTVGTFYDLAGVDCDHVADDYGWTDLRRANVVKTRYGDYILNLPRPKEL